MRKTCATIAITGKVNLKNNALKQKHVQYDSKGL